MRDKILRLEAEIKQLPQVPILTRHYFVDGLYLREITILAGVVLTGKIHSGAHANIVSAGRITVWTDGGMRTVSAPACIIGTPGTKRVGYAHETTVWTTIHANPDNECDLDILEARYIVREAAGELQESRMLELSEGV